MRSLPNCTAVRVLGNSVGSIKNMVSAQKGVVVTTVSLALGLRRDPMGQAHGPRVTRKKKKKKKSEAKRSSTLCMVSGKWQQSRGPLAALRDPSQPALHLPLSTDRPLYPRHTMSRFLLDRLHSARPSQGTIQPDPSTTDPQPNLFI